MGILSFVWHVFLVIWCTGVAATGTYIWTHRASAQLEKRISEQVGKTRIAELQARERRALDAHT